MTRRITEYLDLQASVRERSPRIALILGSGLNALADRLEDAAELPFGAVPGLEPSSAPGHRGVLVLGTWAGVPVLVFAGRLHAYEGQPWRTVVQPIHIAHHLGTSILMATNAAGGIRDDLQPGDLMAVRGHLDCTRPNWWRAVGTPATPLYSPRLLAALTLPTGVYAQMIGPCYETPAEIRALRSCGVDAVGMSTGREIETAFNLGMECAAISCITNKAAGLSTQPIRHEDVLEMGRRLTDRLMELLDAVLVSIVAEW